MVALLLVYILEEEMERLSFASQPRANLPRQPSSEDRESPVPPPPPPLGQGPAGLAPGALSHPVSSRLAVSFPSHLKLSQ